MAPKRNYKKKTMKRRPLKRAPKTTGTAKIAYPKSICDFGTSYPLRAMMKQVYTDTVILTSTLGVQSNYQFCLNSLFDPNITAAGHQPMYFDQMMAIYNHYTVIAAKMTVKFIPYEANVVPSSVVLWSNDDTTTTPGVISAVQEQPGASFTILGSAGDTHTTLVLKYSPKKVFGGSVLGNPNLQGNAAGSPPELTVGQITLVGADNSSTVNVIAQVVIEYVSIYSELKDIAGS